MARLITHKAQPVTYFFFPRPPFQCRFLNLTNDFFGSVFSFDNGQLPPFPNRLPDVNHCIGDITINPDLVFKVLIKLKPNLRAGVDDLPPIFYYNTTTTLSYPLALLFRFLVDLKNIPNEWRLSIVTLKCKLGSISMLKTIDLTCIASKILETLIADQLL